MHRHTLRLGLALAAAGLALVTAWVPFGLQVAPFDWPAGRQTALAVGELHVCKTGGAYTSIQPAVDAAQPGDVIKVAAGVYTETKSIGGFPNNLYISKTVQLFGGYAASCADWTTRNITANVTTIRPATPDISVISVEGQFGQGALLTPTIDGFTVTGGGGGNHGGGLRLRDSNALVQNNIITGNLAYLLGGGIWVQRGAPLIQFNRIERNQVTPSSFGDGGGIDLEDTQATVLGNIIANNVVSNSSGYGGGIAVDGGGPVALLNNTIQANVAAGITSTSPASDVGYGGGVYVGYAEVNLAGNNIMNNLANGVFAFSFGGAFGHGGGIYVTNSPAFTLTGNAILTNTAGYKYYLYLTGGGLEINYSQGALTDNLIAGNNANGNILFGNGGGLAVYTSTLAIQGGQILNNKTAINCEGYGGGLYSSNSKITLDATRLENNCAANTPFYGLGGALAFFNSPYTVTNALILNNYAFPNDTAVGGLYGGPNSPGLLANDSLVNNKGQGIRVAAPITLTNSIIMSHTTGISLSAAVPANVTFNDFYANSAAHQRGIPPHISNITINPQLDAAYHLMAGSPLIDAGTHTNAPDHDVDGELRPMIGTSGLYRVDIGADERSGPGQRTYNLDSKPADLTLIGPGNPQENPNSNSNHDWIGYSVMGADVSGDTLADLVVAAEDWAEDADTVNATGRLFGIYNTGARISGTIDLLTSTASITVVGKYTRQHMGAALTSGDINVDGKRDLIFGSYDNDNDNTNPVTPTVFVLWGGATLTNTRTLTNPSPADFQVRAPAQDFFAYSAKNALTTGDVNGDNKTDLVIGDYLANDTAQSLNSSGAIFVIYGRSTLSGLWDLKDTAADYTLYGPANNAGLGSVALGRVNNDTQVDMVARSDTTAYVIFGPLSGSARHLSATPADITITGLEFGGVLVVDITGDGLDDIILGSNNKIYVIPGPLTGGQSFAVSSQATLILTGVTARSLDAGDVVGDARPDLIIGAPSQKQAFVIAGGFAGTGTLPIADAAAAILQSATLRNLGWDVAAGDLDNDGRPDLLVTTWQQDVSNHPAKFEDAGEVFVFYGSPACYDANQNGRVDVGDIQSLAAHLNQAAGNPDYDARADLDHNSVINSLDLTQVAQEWRRACP